jgi:hypothetical protein
MSYCRSPGQASTIPNNAPAVSFDTALGQQHGYVDFDYSTFSHLAHQLGLEDSAIGELDIQVVPKISPGVRGSYCNGEIQIKAGEKANRALVHELSHAADDAKGECGSEVRNLVGDRAMTLTSINSPLIIGSHAMQVAIDHDIPRIMYNTTFITGLVLAAAAFWGYMLHPDEVRARKSERTHNAEIITLQKRGHSQS